MIFGHHGVAAFEFVSPRFWRPETGGWANFNKSDQNEIFGPYGVPGFQFVSPWPGQPDTGGWVDFG